MLKFFYKNFIKPILFLFDAEFVHESMLSFGEFIGRFTAKKWFLKKLFGKKYPELKQNILDIDFDSPIGLAAGFDYEAKLTQILPSLGFGFQTVGTITNQAYEGNQKPRLGRLPRSKSLMVNKGFKNKGAKVISEKISRLTFGNAVGVSIGVTNTEKITTIEQGIHDIVSAFKTFSAKGGHATSDVAGTFDGAASGGHASGSTFHFYELNISCPNLKVKIDFYPHTYNQEAQGLNSVQDHQHDQQDESNKFEVGVGVNALENLNKLLRTVSQLGVKKPIFIKMPINITDDEALAMLKVIVENKIAGVIFGNLQKDRNNEILVKEEVQKFSVGNFSGKSTEKRSNELIKLSYQNFGKQLVVIGCGGVFSAQDAYKKIKLGASLVQMITGLVFEGPQLVSDINRDLAKLLRKDGFKNISEAVGTEK